MAALSAFEHINLYSTSKLAFVCWTTQASPETTWKSSNTTNEIQINGM